MVEVREVKTKKEQREFLQFPLKLYRDNPYFVPPLYGDEKQIFSPKHVYYDTCEAACFNAYRDGCMTGRIMAILQRAPTKKRAKSGCGSPDSTASTTPKRRTRCLRRWNNGRLHAGWTRSAGRWAFPIWSAKGC